MTHKSMPFHPKGIGKPSSRHIVHTVLPIYLKTVKEISDLNLLEAANRSSAQDKMEKYGHLKDKYEKRIQGSVLEFHMFSYFFWNSIVNDLSEDAQCTNKADARGINDAQRIDDKDAQVATELMDLFNGGNTPKPRTPSPYSVIP